MSGSFLDRMAQASRARADSAKLLMAEDRLLARAEAAAEPVALDLDRFVLIAEIKRRSPSEGALADGDLALDRVVTTYVNGGASCISVLTEPEAFDGSLEDLSLVASLARDHDVPAMRKDFLVDPYQVLEARAAGASGVLLIARILNDAQLESMIDAARSQQMFVLLESFDEADLIRSASQAAADVLLGLNCRDLRSLEIRPQRFEQLAPSFPESCVRIAESGLHDADDVARVAGCGYGGALIGTSLMKDANALEQLRAMKSAAHSARRAGS